MVQQRGPLRQDIVSSWERCLRAGLRPERLEIPYQPVAEEDSPLSRAAAPVIDRLAEDVDGVGGLLLTDERGVIVGRSATERRVRVLLDRIDLAPGAVYTEEHAGTNAIGTAIVEGGSSVVAGSEHFVDALSLMACAAYPIIDAAGHVAGVLDLTCLARDFHPLMLPLVKRAAAEIAQGLPGEPLAVLAQHGGLAGDAGRHRYEWSRLTAAERLVAGLVADGLTNREVARRLSLSRHTIDFHLRQIYRKLGVRSRVELARVSESAAQAETIAAASAVRQRVERDLHDQVQRELVLLSARARRAGASDSHDVRELKGELIRVADGLTGTLEIVREAARETHRAARSADRPGQK